MKNGRKWKTTQPDQLKWKSREKQVRNRKFVKLRLKKKEYIDRESVYIYIKKERGINKGKTICKYFL